MRRLAWAAVACAIALPHTGWTMDIPENSPVADALRKAEAAIQKIVSLPDGERNFDNTVGAIDDMIVTLRLDTEFTQFMAQVSTDAREREAGQLAEEHVRNFYTELNHREDLYKVVKAYAATKPKLEGEQKRLLEFVLRDFRRAGMDLPPEQRERLKQIELEQNRLEIEFDRNIRDDETRVPLNADELKGVPEDVIAKQPRAGDVILWGMEYPSYVPLMTYCENEATRAKVYVAYKRRAGRNIAVLDKLLKLRAEEAKLLGFASPAAFVTEVLMTKNPETVAKFYSELRPLVRKKALQDLEEIRAAKREHTGWADAVVYAWDEFFYENYLQRTKYAVDSEKVKEYFPLDRVLDGMFKITSTLFGIEYKDVTDQASSRGRPLWHPDVRLFEVWDKQKNKMLGEVYLDLFPRENKYNHFAQFGLFPQKVWSDGRVQKPVVALVCNFSPPGPDKPSLMPHDEVETFFHEFGHCLHSILADTKYGWFSGTAVARDFVEAPSQMLENWVWNADVLRTFARHYKTGEPLPDDLLKAMVAAKNLMSGMKTERQIFYGLVDQRYHSAPDGVVDTTKVGLETMAECELYPPIQNTHFQAAFGHLTGYQASYYGYLWSKVFAQDMFTRFREKGVMSPEAGLYYRGKIIGRGGTMDEMDMLKDYLGREPKMDAFVEDLGLKSN
jgi:thimet oligopeptidase